jgi:MFS family permease
MQYDRALAPVCSTFLDGRQSEKKLSSQTLRALDVLNFFLADVRGGVGPYLVIYLLTSRHWDLVNIGTAMSALGVATVVAQTPAGTLIDTLAQKRLLIALAAVLIGASCVATTIFTSFYAVLAAQVVVGVAAAIFPPAVAAISLGIVGHQQLAARIGRNEAFNHAGNVAAAVLAGLVGHFIAWEWIFYLVAIIAVASILAVLFIKPADIDHCLARGGQPELKSAKAHLSVTAAVLTDRTILIFSLTVTLFHLANAAMLPLAGQLLSTGEAGDASLYMSACIIAAQLVMVPVAVVAGKGAERWGRRPILLLAFAVLPIRGMLYTLSNNPFFIVSVQLLDGIGAGILGVVWVIAVADLTKGTGRYNVTQGAIATAQGIGAAFSNLVAEYIVKVAGYNAAFLGLAGIAALALAIFYTAMPETREVGAPAGLQHLLR